MPRIIAKVRRWLARKKRDIVTGIFHWLAGKKQESKRRHGKAPHDDGRHHAGTEESTQESPAMASHVKTTLSDPGAVPAAAVPTEAQRASGQKLSMCSQCQTFKPPAVSAEYTYRDGHTSHGVAA